MPLKSSGCSFAYLLILPNAHLGECPNRESPDDQGVVLVQHLLVKGVEVDLRHLFGSMPQSFADDCCRHTFIFGDGGVGVPRHVTGQRCFNTARPANLFEPPVEPAQLVPNFDCLLFRVFGLEDVQDEILFPFFRKVFVQQGLQRRRDGDAVEPSGLSALVLDAPASDVLDLQEGKVNKGGSHQVETQKEVVFGPCLPFGLWLELLDALQVCRRDRPLAGGLRFDPEIGERVMFFGDQFLLDGAVVQSPQGAEDDAQAVRRIAFREVPRLIFFQPGISDLFHGEVLPLRKSADAPQHRVVNPRVAMLLGLLELRDHLFPEGEHHRVRTFVDHKTFQALQRQRCQLALVLNLEEGIKGLLLLFDQERVQAGGILHRFAGGLHLLAVLVPVVCRDVVAEADVRGFPVVDEPEFERVDVAFFLVAGVENDFCRKHSAKDLQAICKQR